ncbi:MAG TPA: SURF1 family protein [Gemmatimonadales bacterium]|nr:SURF1 family protein [Gemmatimonadales bacterium]
MRRLILLSATVIVGAACLALGVWQLGRLTKRRAANAQALIGRSMPPVVADSTQWGTLLPNRRAELSGTLDSAREFVLRNHLIRGIPAVQIVTPLRIPGQDSAVLVNRGYVPAPDAVDPGPAQWSEPGIRTFHGILLAVPDRGDGNPIEHNGRETWKSLDLHAIRARLPYPVIAAYLVAQTDSADGAEHTVLGTVYPFRAELPPMDEGPHLMYAVQWFGIASAVLAFGVLFILKGGPGKGRNSHQSTVDGTWR